MNPNVNFARMSAYLRRGLASGVLRELEVVADFGGPVVPVASNPGGLTHTTPEGCTIRLVSTCGTGTPLSVLRSACSALLD